MAGRRMREGVEFVRLPEPARPHGRGDACTSPDGGALGYAEACLMRVLLVHPSALMYSEIFLRLEPLGLERVAAALLADGHDVRLIDLQVYRKADLERQVVEFRPEAVGFSLNYLANVPEVVDLAKRIKVVLPGCFVFVGGHSVSFVAEQVLGHADGAIDVVLKGEGETGAPALLAALPDRALTEVPGAVTRDGPGRPPRMLHSLDDLLPARHLGGRRHKYFIGVMDPAASIEFTRGCPWDCSFCSAWTFYGRSYRRLSPDAAVEDMARIAEPGVFIVDDVAFIKAEDGDEIARQLERRKHPQAVLPGNPLRRAAPQRGGVPPLEAARA